MLTVRPWTIKKALPWNADTHRRLKSIQGALWALRLERDGEVVGCAIVAHAARRLAEKGVLCVARVAVVEGVPNGCSKLYGACSRAARSMGATGLVTYTHGDEPGTSLKAAGWIDGGLTDGGEWDRPSRQRDFVVDPEPKRRWFAPWSAALLAPVAQES